MAGGGGTCIFHVKLQKISRRHAIEGTHSRGDTHLFADFRNTPTLRLNDTWSAPAPCRRWLISSLTSLSRFERNNAQKSEEKSQTRADFSVPHLEPVEQREQEQ